VRVFLPIEDNNNISDLSTLDINNVVSSIKVYGGTVAVLYDNANYGGNSYVYDTDTLPVISNDTASSIKIFDGNKPLACVHANGHNDPGMCLDANTPNFSTFGIDNAVSSIKVYGGVVAILYNDANYGGSGYIYDTNTSPVASNDTASSLKILNGNEPLA
jgi:uncharacterized Zn-finger protein